MKTQPEARTTRLCLHSFELLSEKKSSKECIILIFNHMLFYDQSSLMSINCKFLDLLPHEVGSRKQPLLKSSCSDES